MRLQRARTHKMSSSAFSGQHTIPSQNVVGEFSAFDVTINPKYLFATRFSWILCSNLMTRSFRPGFRRAKRLPNTSCCVSGLHPAEIGRHSSGYCPRRTVRAYVLLSNLEKGEEDSCLKHHTVCRSTVGTTRLSRRSRSITDVRSQNNVARLGGECNGADTTRALFPSPK